MRKGGKESRLILVVCNVRFYREGVADALSADGARAIACAHSEVVETRGRLDKPVDVALVDLSSSDAMQTLEQLRSGSHPTRIVGLTIAETAEEVFVAATFAVRAFVSREQSLEELVATVRRAAADEAVCPPSIAAVLFDRVAHRALPGTPQTVLTPREREISSLMARGLTNKQIATSLVICPATVKNHVHNILQKLGVERRGEAAALLRR
jgi:two-component system nitrate/nitrite response regulator NarL